MTEQRVPICPGQEWEITTETGRHRVCVVSAPFRASFPNEPGAWCVALQRAVFPDVITCDRLRAAGTIVGYPASETLEMARSMRASGSPEIAALHASADAEIADDHPERKRAVSALYHHALAEAGAFVNRDTEQPFATCPVCAFPAA
jgi:hypothetical protein